MSASVSDIENACAWISQEPPAGCLSKYHVRLSCRDATSIQCDSIQLDSNGSSKVNSNKKRAFDCNCDTAVIAMCWWSSPVRKKLELGPMLVDLIANVCYKQQRITSWAKKSLWAKEEEEEEEAPNLELKRENRLLLLLLVLMTAWWLARTLTWHMMSDKQQQQQQHNKLFRAALINCASINNTCCMLSWLLWVRA